jgi:hypothetical protein
MNYAIVIGIDHYKERPLNGAVADAAAFADWLKTNNLIVYNTGDTIKNQKYLKLLTSAPDNEIALGHEIDIAINDISDDVRKYKNETNRLYFYFSGHGVGVSYSKTALCLRYWYSKLPNFCISISEYIDGVVNKGVFDELLVFLDCCREYDYQINTKPPGFDYQTKVGTKESPSILTCYSTTYGKLSYEIKVNSEDSQLNPDQKRGAFTSFLIEALKGDADSTLSGRITGSDLKKHIKEHFQTYALKNNKIQAAKVTDDNGDAIVICNLVQKAIEYNFIITFNRTSNVSLFGPDAEEIFRSDVVPGQKWFRNLAKGYHRVKDNNTNEEKYFANYSVNTINNEEF